MNKKNVLHVLDLLEPGGAQILMKGIFEHQADDETIFLLALRKIDVEIDLQHKNYIQAKAKQKYSISSIREFKQVIEKNNIQIVHCHLFKSQMFGWLLKKMYFPNITLIFHEHGQIFHNDFLTNQIFTRFLKSRHSDIDGFIAITNATKYKLMGRAKVPAHKIKRLYNFINVEKFTPSENQNKTTERENLNIKQDAFVVGFAARLIERKGWEDFIHAAKLLENHENIQFLVAGDGEDKEKMMAILEQHNIQNVKSLGYVRNMKAFYAAIDCFVIPSHWEPMGLTELEAQAMGVPVVASNVEGLNEVVHHNNDCLLFEARNRKHLAEQIEKMYQNQTLRKKLVENGRQNVKNFDLPKYITQLEGIYEKITTAS